MNRFQTWWSNASRTSAEKTARTVAAANQQLLDGARRLQGLTDEELIARAEARTSLSHPYDEMEMQRRLKNAIEEQTAESRKSRIWAAWGTAVLAVLTVVLIVLTVVLIRHG